MKKIGIIMAFIAAFLWGISGSLAEYIFSNSNFNVNTYTSLRMFLTGLILLTYGIYSKGPKGFYDILSSKKYLKRIIIYGLLGIALLQYSFAQTINYSNAALATLMQYFTPTIVLIYLSIKTKIIPSNKKVFLVIVALYGMFLMITNGSITNLNVSPLSLIYGLIAAFAFAFYILYITKFKKIDNTIVIGCGMIIGSLIFIPFIDFSNFKELLNINVFIAFMSNVILGNAIPFYLFLESTKYIQPTTTSLLGAIEPIVSIIIGMIFLGTVLTIIQLIGAVLLIGSITIISIFEDI
ncbi:EamA family transporter [Streptobacillus felis]|uniref:EamA family transporter n=1 Tax=Streptobacillus felis TaxID=1384509 RepID=A0A7Z0TAM1_9FUSO|nr:EamA family transporter [Streptobacillus felis]NYV28160.1 EamA family transporter [Streptobacillus felis]